MEKAWIKAWKDLPQDKIRAWIKRIPIHIKEVIRLKGGNEYKEGRKAFNRDHKGTRIKGKLSTYSYLRTESQDSTDGWESDFET
jgi:fructose-bisphosphate aldolase class 1